MALHCAVERNFVEAVELLLSRGADIDAEDKKVSCGAHCCSLVHFRTHLQAYSLT